MAPQEVVAVRSRRPDDAATPTISGVMVVYGRADVAVRAISAWLTRTPGPHELIVVDNDSPDDAAEVIAETFPGPEVTLVRARRNLGFGGGANLGALHARGRLLCILNSDAIVAPGWADPAIEILDAHPDVGVVAPVYLDEDGRLVEAGSVIGPDARTMFVAEPPGLDPSGSGSSADGALPPEVAFTRAIDFASAACLVVRRRAFEAAGGFDPVFSLGYYEDVDLCLRLATLGWRTALASRSLVTHIGQASMGTAEARRRSEENRPILARRWGGVLAVRPVWDDLERFPQRWFDARDATALPRVLAVAGGGEGTATPPAYAARIEEILDVFPWARITVLAQEEGDREALGDLDARVEVVSLRAASAEHEDPLDAWLWSWRSHYSLVVGADTLPAGLLESTQAQAAWVDVHGSPVPRS